LDEISSSANRDGESTREYENGTTTNNHQYAVEFRHPSWKTEGPWELLRHYNIAAVITDSPAKENLEFLSETTITTADHSFVRFHGNRQDKGTDQCS
jgi:uncharacterized protein YecE (DUF72 family)